MSTIKISSFMFYIPNLKDNYSLMEEKELQIKAMKIEKKIIKEYKSYSQIQSLLFQE
jgi:hypothetical protein